MGQRGLSAHWGYGSWGKDIPSRGTDKWKDPEEEMSMKAKSARKRRGEMRMEMWAQVRSCKIKGLECNPEYDEKAFEQRNDDI